MTAFRRADYLLGKFYDGIGNLIGLCIAFFVVAISVDLFMRLTDVGNLSGIQEIIEYMLFVCVFLGAPWVLRMGAHIRVDLFLNALSERAARALNFALDAFGLGISVVLVIFGTFNLKDAYVFQSLQMKYYSVPEWWLLSVFVFSFTLIAFEFLARLLRGPVALGTEEQDAGTF